MSGRHRRPVRGVLAEAALYLALGLLALACLTGIVISVGGGRP